jgi:ADP-heptose:LPS heptosyltransferase
MALNIIKGFIYDIVGFFARLFHFKNQHKKIGLVLRVDEIGDYILWRKFISTILDSKKLENCEVHFVGNQSWKTLFEIEFKDEFQKIIWLDKAKFKKNMIYRFSFLRKIAKEKYSIVINPTYSRAKRVDDSIVKAAGASANFGFVRNNENYLPYEQNFDKELYQHLYEVKNKLSFEFDKNKEFTEWFCENHLAISKINFEEDRLISSKNKNLPSKYFVVFPGSRSSARIWSTSNFIEVSNYIYEKYQLTAIVCGGNGDIVYSNHFIQNYGNPCIDMTSKTSLPELLYIIKNATCLLSVDTGSIHLAASVNCTVLGVFNGSQYGRFSPYPKNINSNIHSFYPKHVIEDINKKEYSKYELISNISYNEVSSKMLIDYLEEYPLIINEN